MTTQAPQQNSPYTFSVANNPKQRRFMESTALELLYSGAFGSGKTRVGCEKGLFLSLKYPGNFGAIIRKTMTSLRYTTMQTWMRFTCPPQYKRNFNQLTNIFELTNGSQVVFLGLDDYQKIGSLELGWAFVDEALEITEDDYMMLLGRLRLGTVPFRQLMLATNPGAPSHHLYQRFFINHPTSTEYVESRTTDNKTLPPDYIASLNRFTGRYYQRYVEGKWVGFEGLVYDVFEPRVHVVAPFRIPSHWRRFRSIDWGFTNPFVCLWFAEHPSVEKRRIPCPEHASEQCPNCDGSAFTTQYNCNCPAPQHHSAFYMYREAYMTQRTAEQHASSIKAASTNITMDGDTITPAPEHYTATFADHDAGDRAVFEQRGIGTTKAAKDISAGVQSVYEMLSQRRIYFFTNTLLERDPALIEAHKPTSLLEEITSYSWKRTASGTNTKEEPSGINDHAMDALRYFCHTLQHRSNPNQARSGAVLGSGASTNSALQQPVEPRGGRNWGQFLPRFGSRWR